MLQASIIFFVLAIIAYIFGANGIAGLSVEIGQILLWVFLALAVLSFFVPYFKRQGPKAKQK